MRLRIIISSLFVIVFGFLSAQNQINWTSFDDINDSLRKEAKPVLIFKCGNIYLAAVPFMAFKPVWES